MTKERSRETDYLPQKGERALIVGATGSGKTGFSTFILQRLPNSPVVIYDTKADQKFPLLPFSTIVTDWKETLEQVHNPEVDYVIVRPDPRMMRDIPALDDLLWKHYEHLHGIPAYIDEVTQFHNKGQAEAGLISLLTRGRSRGITTILATQRPKGISRFALTEIQKAYLFNLTHQEDREYLENVVPNFSDLPKLERYGHYYYKVGEDAAIPYKPIKLDPRFDTGYIDETEEPLAEVVASRHNWV